MLKLKCTFVWDRAGPEFMSWGWNFNSIYIGIVSYSMCRVPTRPWLLEKNWVITTDFISAWKPLKNDVCPLICQPAFEKKSKSKTKFRIYFFKKKIVFKKKNCFQICFSISSNRKWTLDFDYNPSKKALEKPLNLALSQLWEPCICILGNE